ncbi:hypothetical protein HTG_00480 [Natrinema mahii]|nr:hypothetical protein HTG_00480 [Natrinema mahii]
MTTEPPTAVDADEGDRPRGSRDAESATEASPALVVDGLTKRFGSGDDAVTAVDDVSFAIDSGSVVGLLGPNGAGKTTAIKSILGLVVPDSGSVSIDGIDARESPHAAHGRVDAMLEGARNDYWRLTVRENLRYFASISGADPSAASDRHEELLEQLDLAAQGDEVVRNLSRGMKQKVSLASVLASDASVVFLDEPTLGLDIESSLTLRSELRRIVAERELTVIVSSHDMSVIEDVCDRVIVMQDGRVVADETVSELLDSFETQEYRIVARGLEGTAVAAIREAFPDADVTETGDRVRVTLPATSSEFYRLVARLEAENARIDSVDSGTPDMEAAFLELTGGGDR